MKNVTTIIIKVIALLMSFFSMLILALKFFENELPDFEDELNS